MKNQIVENDILTASEKKLAKVVLVIDGLLLVILPLWFLQTYNPFNILTAFALCIFTIINLVPLIIFLDKAYAKIYDIRHMLVFMIPLFLVLSSDLFIFITVAGFLVAFPVNVVFFVSYLTALAIFFQKKRNNVWLSKRVFIFYVVPALLWAEFLVVLYIRANFLNNL